MVHILKIWPEYFHPILTGAKTVELRTEIDRTFAVGDVLRLCEYVPNAIPAYIGRTCAVRVTHVLRDPEGQWLAPNVAALSIQRLHAD
ncbi:DUF3850 domain-containing protein [Sulfobacillus sp. hq2]|uniref:DUF3850 domain-containing protein n=1 Tax=Sulfobacillus TaxID=28033 RepID=UPI000CD2491D|nr:DUF3850 domain-containing protein [Sulfobacillus sp. hq2]POB12305.1 hypothetical protein CO251_00110 [Sulfobacillus sp. hq2]